MARDVRYLPTVPEADRPTHPAYGRALSGQPWEVGGVVFWPFKSGILASRRISTDGLIEVYQSHSRRSLHVVVHGKPLDKRFRSFGTAMRAGVAAFKEAKK